MPVTDTARPCVRVTAPEDPASELPAARDGVAAPLRP